MTPRPGLDADLATLREALAIAWPEGDHAEPNVYTEALAALDRVEAELARLTARRSRYAEGRYRACMEELSAVEAELASLRGQEDALDRAYQARDDWKAEAQRLREEREDLLGQRDDARQGERGWQARAEAAEARCAQLLEEQARLRQALGDAESAALKAAQLLPMTVSTSVEAEHRENLPRWAGWLLRHKVLPVAREALAGPSGPDTPADSQPEETAP